MTRPALAIVANLPRKLTVADQLGRRGYHVEYRGDGSDHCPGCGRQHFYVGRSSAECAFCGTAMPLVGRVDG